MEVDEPAASSHSRTLLHLGGCWGLGQPEEVSPTWTQPCGVSLAEEEGPIQPGPSQGRAMTTSEEPSPAQPDGTNELRWVLRVSEYARRRGDPGVQWASCTFPNSSTEEGKEMHLPANSKES